MFFTVSIPYIKVGYAPMAIIMACLTVLFTFAVMICSYFRLYLVVKKRERNLLGHSVSSENVFSIHRRRVSSTSITSQALPLTTQRRSSLSDFHNPTSSSKTLTRRSSCVSITKQRHLSPLSAMTGLSPSSAKTGR